MKVGRRHEPTDTQWQRLQRLLLPQKGGRGRSAVEYASDVRSYSMTLTELVQQLHNLNDDLTIYAEANP
jgi:hypothetical protein